MAHDTCLQSAFSTHVGISGYCIRRGVQTWLENKESFSTSLEKPWFSYTNNLGCHREFFYSGGKGWFLISSEANHCPSIANCSEQWFRFPQCKRIQDALPWVTKDFLRVHAKVGSPFSSFDKISTLVCFACMACLTTFWQERIIYGSSPQLLGLSYTDTVTYLICRKVQSA